MNTPEKCPKCGEEIMYYGHRFRLAGERSEERCLKVQRDQLAERVKRLEEAADAMAKAYEEILWDRHDAGILENYRKVRGEK